MKTNTPQTTTLASLTLLTTLLAIAPKPAQAAAAFTAGNIVVYRAGSGTGSLVNTGNPVFLDEFTPAGALAQTIPMPTTASGAQYPLIASGTATSEGFLTRSANGNYLVAPGYGTNTGGSSLSGTTAITVPRVIARIDSAGTVDTSTALTNWTSGNNPRSAASTDGTQFWGAGGSGLNYAPALGATSSTPLSNATPAVVNARALCVHAGQLYVSSSSTSITRGIATVGTGLPTSGNQTYAILPGMTDNSTLKSPYGYFLCHLNGAGTAPDTLYVCDDTTTGAPGGISKFSLVAGAWVTNGITGTAADSYRGLCGTVNGTTVTLYATRKGGSGAAGGGELVTLTDTNGYNTAIGTPAITVLATAAANTAFRGVALAPIAPITTPVVTGIQVSGGNVLIDFTAGTTDSTNDFSVVSTTDLATPLTPTAATITATSGPGQFRASIPLGTAPAAFYRIKR